MLIPSGTGFLNAQGVDDSKHCGWVRPLTAY